MQDESNVKEAGANQSRRLSVRRTPNQTRARETVQAILRAAALEIEENGLDRLTTRRIAEAAGISVGGLYEYFPNKQSVVNAMIEEWMQKVFEAIENLHPDRRVSKDLVDYLHAQIDHLSRIYRDEPCLSAVLTMLSSVPELTVAVQQHDRKIAESVTGAISHFAPDAPPGHVAAMARTISLIGHEMLCEAFVRKSEHADKLVSNLKVCVSALSSQLLLLKK